MAAGFEAYIRTHTSLGDEQIGQIVSLATPKIVQRNEYVLQQGQVCRHKVFVVKGLLATMGTMADGSEHILQFSPEDNWTLDAESYDLEKASTFNIVAIERSELLLWNKPDFNHLLSSIPELKELSQKIISSKIYETRQRLLTTLGATPEEKYEEFTQKYTDLLPRLPLRMIAGYLGISVKTLTRIRHAQLHR